MDTEELQFTLAPVLSKGQSYLCLLKEKWGGEARAHLILGKDLEECNIYYREMEFNEGSRPWGWFINPES